MDEKYKLYFMIEETTGKASESTTYLQMKVNELIEKCGYTIKENSCLFVDEE